MKAEAPPAEGLLQFLYDNPFGKTAILPIAKRKFISEIYGRRMDRPSSVKRIQDFVDQLGIDMSESKKPVEEFRSFNDFFYRELVPEARPIGEGFISPGDGRLLAFEKVSEVNSFFTAFIFPGKGLQPQRNKLRVATIPFLPMPWLVILPGSSVRINENFAC